MSHNKHWNQINKPYVMRMQAQRCQLHHSQVIIVVCVAARSSVKDFLKLFMSYTFCLTVLLLQ